MDARATAALAMPVLLTLTTLLAASGCVVGVQDDSGVRRGADLVQEGRAEFLCACASCHGRDARGLGPVAAALRTPPTDLTELAARGGGHFPRARVIRVLTGEVPVTAHGSREMPVWSERFAPTDSGATAAASIYARRWLETLATYLESIQRPGEQRTEAGAFSFGLAGAGADGTGMRRKER